MPVKKQELTRPAPLPNLGFVTESPQNSPFNTRLSEDLTVILLRGNGSPRTFRLSVPALQRSLTALGFTFALAIAAAVLMLLWNLLHLSGDRVEQPAPLPPPPVVAAPAPSPAVTLPPTVGPAPGVIAKPGFWSNLTSGNGGADVKDDELHKELQGLRDDIAKMAAEANGRHGLAPGVNAGGLLQFFGPRNVVETDASIQIKNVKVSHAGNEYAVDFEVTNVDPNQRQIRGYIVVLAKTPNLLLSYPDGVFNPNQNIVLDYTKGETFGVSRLRPTRATFPAASLDGKKPRFQILLFGTDGKVIADLHIEGDR